MEAPVPRPTPLGRETVKPPVQMERAAMRRNALDVLACPMCLAPLQAPGTAGKDIMEGSLRCTREGVTFPVTRGVPELVRPDRVTELAAFAESYSRAWQRDGWVARDEQYRHSLPSPGPGSPHASEWRVKARSMAALFRVLDGLRPRRIVDLGSGVGWLSHHLARRGYEVYAIDAVRDDRLGLAAAGVYVRTGPHFERVWGELERPPLHDGSVDVVACNASLHYARSLDGVLSEANRVLRPGGSLIVLNSPVHRDARSAARAQADFRERLRRLGAGETVASTYHHFTRDALREALNRRVGPVTKAPFDPGRTFRWWRRVKGLLLGMELASFPLLVARKPGVT